ncbi:MAG: chromosomal replication initiator protein DnaA [Leptospiraceae bacterium]|nr:chromosomal replication initiator protein DnaA [Leptospiraceae bacterium]MCP5493880.1 chromosomal replication initiator protein DnaA [Leptospiraceae bacterium]
MEQLWDKILEEVSKQIPAVYYGSFISPLSLLNYDDQKLVIVAPSKTIKNHVEQKYQHYIEEAIYKIGGSKLKVEINIDSQSSFIGDLVNEKFKDNNLSFNSDYTFDEFAVGESNRLAFSACQEILKRPGEINPLYIHGGVSVGKTHLLQAIGRELQSKFPPNTVKYLPISNFLSEFVFTLQNRQSMEAFRLKYQSYSVLIIDDIQYLNSGAEKTQEEFIALFNHLYDRKKQIIIASDRSSKELPVKDLLRSRFVTGIQVEIKPPNEEIRLEILKRKTKALGLNLTKESIYYIANNFQTDTRGLIGALNDILIFKKTYNLLLLSEQDVKNILDNRLLKIKHVDFDHEKIIDRVCHHFSQMKKDVLGHCRKPEYVVPRHISMYLLYKLCSMNKTTVGRIFNSKHSTVINAIKKVKSNMDKDESYRKKLLLIQSEFEYK